MEDLDVFTLKIYFGAILFSIGLALFVMIILQTKPHALHICEYLNKEGNKDIGLFTADI